MVVIQESAQWSGVRRPLHETADTSDGRLHLMEFSTRYWVPLFQHAAAGWPFPLVMCCALFLICY